MDIIETLIVLVYLNFTGVGYLLKIDGSITNHWFCVSPANMCNKVTEMNICMNVCKSEITFFYQSGHYRNINSSGIFEFHRGGISVTD